MRRRALLKGDGEPRGRRERNVCEQSSFVVVFGRSFRDVRRASNADGEARKEGATAHPICTNSNCYPTPRAERPVQRRPTSRDHVASRATLRRAAAHRRRCHRTP
eukprot:350576-Chlamydomonas_euryale.AAC.2